MQRTGWGGLVNTDFTTSHGQKDTAITGRAINLSAHDASMTVTCKFSKRTTFIPGKTTYTAEDRGLLLLDALLTGDCHAHSSPAARTYAINNEFILELGCNNMIKVTYYIDSLDSLLLKST